MYKHLIEIYRTATSVKEIGQGSKYIEPMSQAGPKANYWRNNLVILSVALKNPN